jgi:hypothetical protein
MQGLLQKLVIFHRKLGTEDESATPEEQHDKILLYLDSGIATYFGGDCNPDPLKKAEQINRELSTMTLLESLIEVGANLNAEGVGGRNSRHLPASKQESERRVMKMVDAVHMHNSSWVFLNCELDVWIAAQFDSASFQALYRGFDAHCDIHINEEPEMLHSNSNSALSGLRRVAASDLRTALLRMYHTFVCLHGPMNRILDGSIHRTFSTKMATVAAKASTGSRLGSGSGHDNQAVASEKTGWSIINEVRL